MGNSHKSGYYWQHKTEMENHAKSLEKGQYYIPGSGVIDDVGLIPDRCLKYYKRAPAVDDIEILIACLNKKLPSKVVYDNKHKIIRAI